MKQRVLFFFTAVLLSTSANAQPAGVLDSLLKQNPSLEELMSMTVISASKSDISVSKAPANIIVVTSQQIDERGYRNLEEVMKDVPGFDFSVGQPAGEYPTHFIFRGIGDVGQTKFVIMVDGIVQNDISNGWMRNVGFNFVMSDIDRIEFVSGPGSALFGANAYAGFVNVITKSMGLEREKPLEIGAQVSYGSGNTISPEIYGSYKFKNDFELHVSGRLFVSQGDGGVDRYDPGNYFHNNFEPDSVLTTQYGNVANNVDAFGETARIAPGFDNSINDYYFRFKMGKDGFTSGFNFWNRKEGLGSEVVGYEYFANTEGIDYVAHHQGMSAYLQYIQEFGDKVTSTSRMYIRNTSIKPQTGFVYTFQYQSVENDTLPGIVDQKKGYSGEGYILGIEQQLNVDISENNRMVVGFQGEQKIREYFGISLGQDQDPNSTIVGSTFPTQEQTVQPVYFSKYGAVFAQDEWRISNPLSLTVGFRYDMDEFYGNVLNPRAALVYVPDHGGFNFKLLYGQAFKAPTIFELQDEWRGNQSLVPELIKTYEAQIGYLFPKWGTLNANVFFNDLDNLIAIAPNPNVVDVPIGPDGQKATYYQNHGSTRMVGLGLRADVVLDKDLSGYANYTYTAGVEGLELNNISAHKANAGVNYLLNDMLNINLRANYVGKTKAPETNRYFYPKTPETITEVGYDYVTEENPDGHSSAFTLLNMTLTGKNFVKNKSFNIEPQLIVRNLLGVEYVQMGRQSGSGTRPVDALQPSIQNPAGFSPAYHPQAGRELFLSLKVTF